MVEGLTPEVLDLPAPHEGQGQRDVVLMAAGDAQELKLEVTQSLLKEKHTPNKDTAMA